jgi:protein-disulfide isomerase
MQKITFLIPLILLSACVNPKGISPESSKTPSGNPNSSIVVEEFSDIQCPACSGAHARIVEPLLEKYGNDISLKFHHFPLRTIHAFAQEAAEASECAADQEKFWEFIQDSYENQDKLSRDDLIARAEKIGVADIDLFGRCVRSRIKKDAVQKDFEEGAERGVNATPTFFLAGEKVQRNTFEAISELIEVKIGSQRL